MKRRFFLFGLTCLALCSQALGAPWTHISNGTWASGDNSCATFVWPSHMSGDQAFITGSHGGNNGATILTPSGWTLESTNSHNGGDDIVVVMSRVATSGSESNVSFCPSAMFGGDIIAGFITVFRGGSLTQSGNPATTSASFVDEIPYHSQTPLADNTLVLMALNWGDVTPGWEPLDSESGWTAGEIGETAGGDDSGTALFYQIQTTATPTGGGTITSMNLVGAPVGSIVIAFEDSAGGGPSGSNDGPWTHVSDGTVLFDSNAGMSIDVQWPSHLTGYVGIMACNLEHAAAALATPSGWTLLAVNDNSGGDLDIFGKVALSGAEADVTINPTGDASSDAIACGMSVFNGGTLTLSAAFTSDQEDMSASTNIPFASYTPVDNGTLVLIGIGTSDADVNSVTDPSGFTEAFYDDTTLGFDSGAGLKWQIQTNATMITGANMTGNDTSFNQTVTFALEANPVGSDQQKKARRH